jgi:FG-GAP repeat protein/putative Ig domain-containing protein
MLMQRFVLSVLVFLSSLAVGVPATVDLGEFGAQEAILGSARNLFGYAVAVSGDYALVGRPDDHGQGIHTGAVYVYKHQQGRWVQVAKLLSNEPGNSRFGVAVALDGDVAVVGVDGAPSSPGAAYIFERRQDTWTQMRKLRPSGSLIAGIASNPYFGQSVAIAGDYVLVGAPGESNKIVGQPVGAVYVFQRQQGAWGTREVQKLWASDAKKYSGFGTRVAVAGSYALVGSPDHDRGGSSAHNYGAAYVFELVRGGWYEVAKLQASDGAPLDYFGSAVALSDQEAVIGAYGHDGKGAAYLFARQAGTWTEVHKLTAHHGTPGDRFGAAVALAGNVMLIGAYAYAPWWPPFYHDHNSHAPDIDLEEQGGIAYVFERQTSGWREVEQLPARLDLDYAHFGYAVALSERHALVGAPALFGGPPGRVYAYSNFRSNAVPQLISTPVTTATVGVLYRYDVDATDADGHPLAYALISAPVGMMIDATSGLITWTPTAPGNATVELEVLDNHGGRATQNYTITVSIPNQPPRITSTPIASAEVFHVIPQVSISDAHLARQTITLNGQPYTSGTPITADGDYILSVEATSTAGNTSVSTVHFAIRRPPVP